MLVQYCVLRCKLYHKFLSAAAQDVKHLSKQEVSILPCQAVKLYFNIKSINTFPYANAV